MQNDVSLMGWRGTIGEVKASLRRFMERVGSTLHSTNPALEPVFQRLFERDLQRLGIVDKFYAVGAAANFSLLYLILRAAQELQLQTVVELGAGQSSLLLNALVQYGYLRANILTIEHDRDWATLISSGVQHRVSVVDLVDRGDVSPVFSGYELAELKNVGLIDLLLVDGPPAWSGQTKYSRLGALELVAQMNPSGFLIVIDDAERDGERLLVKRIHAELQRRKFAFRRSAVIANKRQEIFAGGALERAAFF